MKKLLVLLITLASFNIYAADIGYVQLDNGDKIVITNDPCTIVPGVNLYRIYIKREKLSTVESCFAITDKDIRAVFPYVYGTDVFSLPLDGWHAFTSDMKLN